MAPRSTTKSNANATATNGDPWWKPYLAGGITIVALIGFALFVIFLAILLHATVSETQWDRYTYLLTGVESITFAAVGWVFGKEVHREQAQQADQRANTLQHQATISAQNGAQAETKFRALTDAIHAKKEAQAGKANNLTSFININNFSATQAAGVIHGATQADLDELDDLATRLSAS